MGPVVRLLVDLPLPMLMRNSRTDEASAEEPHTCSASSYCPGGSGSVSSNCIPQMSTSADIPPPWCGNVPRPTCRVNKYTTLLTCKTDSHVVAKSRAKLPGEVLPLRGPLYI